jgi:mRNA interferase MazF
VKRGDIVFVHNEHCTGSEWGKDRYAVVVSNDACNLHSPVIEVVFLTTSHRKRLLPTHVIIRSAPRPSVVLCEAVYSVDKVRVEESSHHCSPAEMRSVDHALMVSLGLDGAVYD